MRARWLVMGLVVLSAACGGGSGGDPAGGGPATDAFAGDYGFAGFSGREAGAYGLPRSTARAWWGTLTADGAGAWDLNGLVRNADGEVAEPTLTGGPLAYHFDDLHVLDRTPNLMGPMREDGAVGASIQFTPPRVEVIDRRGGALEPGDYGIVMFSFALGADSSFWGTLTVAPGGAVADLVLSSNTHGTLTLDTPVADGAWTTTADGAGAYRGRSGLGSTDGLYVPGSLEFDTERAYTVAANGAMTLFHRVGFDSADGRTVLLAGEVDGLRRPGIGVYVR